MAGNERYSYLNMYSEFLTKDRRLQHFYILEKCLIIDKELRQKNYFCGSKFVPLQSVPTWEEQSRKSTSNQQLTDELFQPNADLNKKVSLWRGDITVLEVDAIVNAANKELAGGGGGKSQIHLTAS